MMFKVLYAIHQQDNGEAESQLLHELDAELTKVNCHLAVAGGGRTILFDRIGEKRRIVNCWTFGPDREGQIGDARAVLQRLGWREVH